MSTVHTVKRTSNYSDLIKSKEPLVFQTGFRSFEAKPIYSESNLNCDKHRMERFLREGNFSAGVYGPITYMPCPLLVYKKIASGQPVLVATGSLTKSGPRSHYVEESCPHERHPRPQTPGSHQAPFLQHR